MSAGFFPLSQREAQNSFYALQDQLAQQQHMILQLSEMLEHTVQDMERNYVKCSELKAKLQSFSTYLDDLQSKMGYELTQIQKNLQSQSEVSRSILSKLDAMSAVFFQKQQLVNVRFERSYYKNFPTFSSDSYPEFQQDFLALTQNLDADSIETITLALKRLFIIQHSTDEWLSLYSNEEKQVIEHIREHFLSSITPLSVSCFYCNGYMLPINHFESCVFWDRCGIPHLNHPERLNNLDIIDAGAFIGDSALIFSELTSGTVHAFEPVPDNYQYMLETITLNQKQNITPNLAALGDHCGKLAVSINDSSSSHFQNSAFSYQGQVEADMLTVDEYVDRYKLKIGLIKADVEGAEQMLLRGAINTIKTQRPALLISIYHNADDFFHIKPMLENLNLGYRFKVRHPICGSVLTETLLIAEVD